ncbi:MAG: hypothetical protein LBN07_00055 [Christensenellaceae bacterium]|jgi:hypothetical protein|nr:hypothetical protein [Christensenellaceae bacterium]
MNKKDTEKERLRKERERHLIDNKLLFKIYAVRFLLIMAFAVPVAIVIDFIIEAYTGLESWAYIIIDLGILLLSCLIGLIIYNKIDERRALKPKSKEDERDPFSD